MRIGGAEQVIYNLVENTDKSMYDLSIICLDSALGPFGRQLQERGCQITSFNRKPGFDVSLIRDIRRHIKDHDIDVLHCHQYTPYVYGLLGSLGTKTKVIFTEHGRFYPDERRVKRVLINPLLNNLTAHVTAISSATLDALVEFENFPRKKIKVIYNGIDDQRFIRQGNQDIRIELDISQEAYILGTVARLDPIKNHKMMINAMKAVNEKFPKTYLVIVGDGAEKECLEALAKSLKLTDRIIFTGYREDTEKFYAAMDIFLLTSFSEGTAMTLLEAMAAGLPCIVTGVGGNPEIVKDGETGFVIPSDDVKVLAEKICMLLKDIDLKKRMGHAGRKRFEERFTVDKMVREYETLYDGKQ